MNSLERREHKRPSRFIAYLVVSCIAREYKFGGVDPGQKKDLVLCNVLYDAIDQTIKHHVRLV